MLKKYIKASLLVIFMASSVSLTSCKKKDDPKPIDKKEDVKEDPKPVATAKETTEKKLQVNAWEVTESTDQDNMIGGIVFTSPTDVTVYYKGKDVAFGESKEVTYEVSEDGNTITIKAFNKTFTITTINATTLVVTETVKDPTSGEETKHTHTLTNVEKPKA